MRHSQQSEHQFQNEIHYDPSLRFLILATSILLQAGVQHDRNFLMSDFPLSLPTPRSFLRTTTQHRDKTCLLQSFSSFIVTFININIRNRDPHPIHYTCYRYSTTHTFICTSLLLQDAFRSYHPQQHRPLWRHCLRHARVSCPTFYVSTT